MAGFLGAMDRRDKMQHIGYITLLLCQTFFQKGENVTGPGTSRDYSGQSDVTPTVPMFLPDF